MSLTVEDFPSVFTAIHGHPPFAWQTRLLHTVIETGWPGTIAAPTGAGKTAVLDIALFHLAFAPQCAPRRIVFAVDRRVIVDQAHKRSLLIRNALATPANKCVGAMADALSAIAGGDKPVHVEALRGGMPREDEWARSPIQPTILSTTVDQLGSRLLFRGYGVSAGMAPIHAGLLGEDALLFLDEAHLSNAFQETLKSLKRRRKAQDDERGVTGRWAFASLSATPATVDDHVFVLNEAERAEAMIAQRIAAPKSAELLEINGTYSGPNHVEAFLDAANRLSKLCAQPEPTIAIIVNRVALARAILQGLKAAEHEAILLTGRVRPLERDDLIKSYGDRLQGDSTISPGSPAKPLFVVATQCIEAGADFDFSAMVTQIAPLDALRQRFGRLNRRGQRDQGPAAIITTKLEIGRNTEDPLYGKTLRETWAWLDSHATQQTAKSPRIIQVSPASFDALVKLDPEAAAKCATSTVPGPVLRPADVGLFAMTQPKPHPDPYLPLFLHGKVDSQVDVSFIWRADCEIIDQANAFPSETDLEKIEATATSIVACLPPRPGEALNVPIWAAQFWLDRAGAPAANLGDVESEAKPPDDGRGTGGRYVLRWRGPGSDETKLVRVPAETLASGDVIIVPASYGGCDAFGWAPQSREPVRDIADQAADPYAKRYYAVRLHPALWKPDEVLPWSEFWASVRDDIEDGSPRSLLAGLIAARNVPPEVENARRRFEKMPKSANLQIETPYLPNEDDSPSGAVLVARRGVPVSEHDTEASVPPATEDDLIGSYDGSATLLEAHNRAVGDMAAKFAAELRLPARLEKTVNFAGRHHDDGKADPRFQRWLGREETGELLAKSLIPLQREAFLAARDAAGVPQGWRHEVLSVRIASQILQTKLDDIDGALALYLIGTHHGHGRPFFGHDDPWDTEKKPRRVLDVEVPPDPGPERLNFDWQGRDWAELTIELQDRYGVWGLAFLEALLRLADHRVSGQLP